MPGPHYAPVSISCFVFWTLSLRFRRTFHIRAIHPSYAVLCLKLMPSHGWGFTAVDLTCLPSFENRKKAKDVLKEAIIQSTGGGTVSRASAGPSASTSTEPTQIEKDTNAPPLTSSSTVHSPSKCRHTKSPSPQRSQSDSSSNEESASGHESKSSHSSSSSSSQIKFWVRQW